MASTPPCAQPTPRSDADSSLFSFRWVGILAFGEGWHNNHHAFEFSARHGLEWWQVDLTWGIVSVLKSLGLVSKVKLPSKVQMDKLRFAPA